jgi:hypothetical protein
MSRIEMTATVQSLVPPIELVDKILLLAKQQGIKFTQVAVNQVDFRRGSQAAIRIKGALLSKSSDFPVVTVMRCDVLGTGSNVIINSLDDLGIGLKLGVTKKYNVAVREFGEIIAALVTQAESSRL